MRPKTKTAMAFALLLLAGCSTHRGTVMSDVATLDAEPQGMWSRPLEMGYEVIGDVQGEADAQYLLGIKRGAETTGVALSLFGVFGNAFSRKTMDPIVGTAAYNAVVGSGADAIYVTRWELKKDGFPPFYQYKKATVQGKALRLVDYGPVERERVDQQRLGHPFSWVVETDGTEMRTGQDRPTPPPPAPPPPVPPPPTERPDPE